MLSAMDPDLSSRSAAVLRRVIERHEAGGPWRRRPRLPTHRNTDRVLAVLAKKVMDTDGRISAKRLLPVARAAGYSGSARNLRRAVAARASAAWPRTRATWSGDVTGSAGGFGLPIAISCLESRASAWS